MKQRGWAAALALGVSSVAAGETHAPPADPELVGVQERIPDLISDLRYATPNNFLGRAVYPANAKCLLVARAVTRLARAAAVLRKRGLRLRVYDCYRPLAVQWAMWKIYPHPGYVADPHFGSNHNRGAAVDVTLATADGQEVEMPSGFDSFSKAAHHGFTGASPLAAANRELLLQVMRESGFRENRMEWWHYDLPEARLYPVLDRPFDANPNPQNHVFPIR